MSAEVRVVAPSSRRRNSKMQRLVSQIYGLCKSVSEFSERTLFSPVARLHKTRKKKLDDAVQDTLRNTSPSIKLSDIRSNVVSSRLFAISHVLYNAKYMAKSMDVIDLKMEFDSRMGKTNDLPNSLNLKGAILLKQGEEEKAVTCFKRGLNYFLKKRQGKKGAAVCYNNIGVIYKDMKRYNEAEDCYRKSIRIYKKLGNKQGEGETLNNIGDLLRVQERYNSALKYYQDALLIKKQFKRKFGEGFTLQKMGCCKINMAERFKDCQKSIDAYNSIEDNHYKALEVAKYVRQVKIRGERMEFLCIHLKRLREKGEFCMFTFAKMMVYRKRRKI